MQYYRAIRTKPLLNHPPWMILKAERYQEYFVILIADAEKYTNNWRCAYTKGVLVGKTVLNKTYHLIPIAEEEAATEIFLEY